MGDGIEQVPNAPPEVETPAMFLAEVGKALSEEEGGDVELADIPPRGTVRSILRQSGISMPLTRFMGASDTELRGAAVP